MLDAMGEGKRPSAEAETRKAKKWEGNAGPSSLVVHVARPENIMERESNVPYPIYCVSFCAMPFRVECPTWSLIWRERDISSKSMAKGEFFFNQMEC